MTDIGGVAGRVTVAFTLEALEQLVYPGGVFDQTRGWARSVGIVSDRPMHAQTGFAREHGIDYGFHSGPRDVFDTLPVIRTRPEQEADRYLLVGTNEDRERVAARGWEYLSIWEAAEAAKWDVETADGTDERRDWP